MPSYKMRKVSSSATTAARVAAVLAVLCIYLAAPVLSQAAGPTGLPDFRDLVKSAGSAVVNISTEKTEKISPAQRRGLPFPPDFFRGMPGMPGDQFDRFFGPFGGPFGPFGGGDDDDSGQQMPSRRSSSLGSGFIISEDGYIVTNHHVVKGADVIKVTLGERNPRGNVKEQIIEATLIGSDDETDIALIKINTKEKLPYLKFGDSDKLEVGEWAVAIGNPFGLDHSVTAGIISAKGRNINAGAFDSFLQTDASINPGNSGGPLLNMAGEVIGINTAIAAQGQGIGFAIPSNMAELVINELKSNKKVSRGWIGVNIQRIDDATAKALGLKEAKGALLGGVIPGEPADKAGLMAGDVVISVDGQDIEDSDALLQAISGKKPGSKVEMKVIRNGATKNFTLTLAERNLDQAERNIRKEEHEASASGSLGIRLRPLSSDDARRLRLEGVKGGLLITSVEPGKAADDAGMRPGDVILSAALKPVTTPEEFVAIVNGVGRERGAVMLQIVRRGQKFFVTVDLSTAKAETKGESGKTEPGKDGDKK